MVWDPHASPVSSVQCDTRGIYTDHLPTHLREADFLTDVIVLPKVPAGA